MKSNIRIYDNEGETLDCYTAIFLNRPERGQIAGTYEALAFNAAPFHPQGIGMHVSAHIRADLGRRIKFEDLNKDCQAFIRQCMIDGDIL